MFYKVSSDGGDGPPSFVQIFSMNRPGNGQKNLERRVAEHPEVDIQPSVSPDGKTIGFARLDQDTGLAPPWTMTFEGLKQTDISNDAANFSESGPAFSADGSKLLFVRQPPGSFPGDQGGGPATAGGEIWIRNADGSGTPQQVTTGAHDVLLVTSSDGTRIVFEPSSRRSAAHLRHERERGGHTGRPRCRLEAGLVARWNSSRVRAGRWWIRDGRERLESG